MPRPEPDFGFRTDFYTFAPESLADVLPEFVIAREVGQGSMGIVYDATRKSDGKRVALKVLPPSLTLTERALARFVREGEIMARIRHPGIVEVYDLGRTGRLHYFVMEFVDGVNLDARLEVGPLPSRHAAEIGLQVARALQFAHDRGVVHRDIKPSNLILRDDGRIAITDFGLARETGTGSMTESGAIVGTPMFMAPEQVTGDRDAVTSRVDVYGLGATLYTLVCGRPPFEGPSAQQVLRQVLDQEPERPSRWSHDLPRDLEAVILTAIEKDPARRYGTASAIADELQRFLSGERVLARIPGPLTRSARAVRKHRLLSTLVLLIGLLGGSALWLHDVRRRGELDAELARAGGLVAQAVSLRDEQLKPLDEAQRRALLHGATAAASRVIQKDPGVARAWFVRAQAQHHLRDYRQTWNDLDEAERRYGEPTPEVLHYRIDALKNLFDSDARRQLHADLRALLEIDPSPYNRCIVAFHLLDLARAMDPTDRQDLLERAAAIIAPVPEPDAQVSVIRARILELGGSAERGLDAIRDATVAFHGNPLVHEEAAAMYLRRGMVPEGEEQAELARILDPQRGSNAATKLADPDGGTVHEPGQRPDPNEVQRFLRDLQELMRGAR